MQVYRSLGSLPSFQKAAVTIGTFDGVHRGHRQIIRQLTDEAAACGGVSVIVTFDPHPREVLQPGAGGLQLLTTLEEKLILLSEMKVDYVVVVPFTRAFSEMTASAYVTDFLVKYFHPHTIILGYDHHFGHNREGNIQLLRQMSEAAGFRVVEIPEQVVKNLTVSSTKIRNYLKAGDVALARELLGYPYGVSGTVIHGEGRGRALGFPTANLAVASEAKLIPAEGVYAALAELHGTPRPGVTSLWLAAVNIGRLPTFGGRERRIEAYVLDFQGDLYGCEVFLKFEHYLRGDRKFENVEQLVEAIREDVSRVRALADWNARS